MKTLLFKVCLFFYFISIGSETFSQTITYGFEQQVGADENPSPLTLITSKNQLSQSSKNSNGWLPGLLTANIGANNTFYVLGGEGGNSEENGTFELVSNSISGLTSPNGSVQSIKMLPSSISEGTALTKFAALGLHSFNIQ